MNSDSEATLRHLRHLVEVIGSRSAGGPGEHAAAHYAAATLAGFGLPVAVEPFMTPTSSWQPHIRTLVLGLLARVVAELGRPGLLGGALLSTAALGSALAEWNFRDHPIRHTLRHARSQNVVARIEPRGPVRRQVVLTGHLDSPNAPWAFRSLPRLAGLVALLYLSLFGTAANAGFYLAGALRGWPRARRAALPGSLALAALLAVALEGDGAPPSLGANDNASGAALALRLAERLAADRLESTRVWVLCSGAEEIGCRGALAFFRRHRAELAGARVVALESLGCAGPRYTTREGMLGGYRSDRLLVAAAARVASTHPELGARPCRLPGGATEAGAAISRGLGAMALVGLDERGVLPHWHTTADTLAHIDPAALERAETFAWELLAEVESVNDP